MDTSRFRQSGQTCPRCRQPLGESLYGEKYCQACKYSRPAPDPDSVIVGIHGRAPYEAIRPRLEHLVQNLKVGGIATLFDTGSPLALAWALDREVDLHPYACGAKMGNCCSVILVGEPRVPVEQITEGVPHRVIRRPWQGKSGPRHWSSRLAGN